MENKFAIIVAGGSGTRMKSDIPKQFLELNGKPILMHSIEKFASIPNMEILLVLPEDQIGYWQVLCKDHNFEIPVRIVYGGPERFFSVKYALETIQEARGIVAIHDGVRPFIRPELIEKLLESANKNGSAVPCTHPKESMREITETGNKAIDRNKIRMVQTPQCFELFGIKHAYENEFSSNFTDDASVYEHNGGEINLVEGDYSNIKITTEEDLSSYQSNS